MPKSKHGPKAKRKKRLKRRFDDLRKMQDAQRKRDEALKSLRDFTARRLAEQFNEELGLNGNEQE